MPSAPVCGDRRTIDVSNLDKDNKPFARDDRRRLFAIGNRLRHSDSSFKIVPAKYSSELVHAHKWRVGDLLMWDNRQTMHRARPFPYGEARDVRRTTLMGDAPTTAQRMGGPGQALPDGDLAREGLSA